MATWLMQRGAASVDLLLGYAAEHGLSARDCLRGTGIEPDALAPSHAEVSSWQELRLIRNLVRALGDQPALGVRIGLRYHLTVYGPMGLAMQTSPTLGAAALLAGTALYPLAFGFCRMEVAPGAITVHPPQLGDDLAAFLVEHEVAAISVMARELCPGVDAVRRIEFGHVPPYGHGTYQELFGCEVRFGAPYHRAVVERGVGRVPLPAAHPRICRQATEQCTELIRRRQVRTLMAGQVRGLLLAADDGIPDLKQVAAELVTSARTLRRRLAAEGTTFRELRTHARIVLAERWLADRELSIEQIAIRLGYSETAAFTHAFTRRTGVSPRAYRAAPAGRLSGR
ncbi:MAG: AraC family transcriptional regulator ligand-binding domain-containing protein [Micromonosporaceae bacterium]